MKRYLIVLMAWLLQSSVLMAEGAGHGGSEPPCDLIEAEMAFYRGRTLLSGSESGDGSSLQGAIEEFQRAVQCDPKFGSGYYWLGFAQLLAGDAEAAVRHLKQSLTVKRPPRADRWRVLAHLGEAQVAAGKGSEAAHSFRKAAVDLTQLNDKSASSDWHPTDQQALHRLDLGLAELGQQRLRSKMLNRTQKFDFQPTAKPENALPLPRYRGPFWPPKGPWAWDGYLEFSVGANSNPNLLHDEFVFRQVEQNPDGSQSVETIEGAEEDGIQRLQGRVGVYRRLGGERKRLGIGFSFSAHQTFHREFDSLDLGQGRLVTQLTWGAAPSSYLLGPLGYSRVPFGSSRWRVMLQAGYLYSHLGEETYRQGPGLALTLRRRNSQLELLAQDFDYQEPVIEDRERSGLLKSVGVSQFIYLRKNRSRKNRATGFRYLRLGARYGEREGGLAYARSFVEGSFETVYRFHRRLRLELYGLHTLDDFEHAESNIFLPQSQGEPRQDATTRLSARLVWTLRGGETSLVASWNYAHRDSELDLPTGLPGLSFDQSEATLGFRWTFGTEG